MIQSRAYQPTDRPVQQVPNPSESGIRRSARLAPKQPATLPAVPWPTARRRELAPIIACHLTIALPLAYLLNIWSDEAFTLYTTGNGVLDAAQRGLRFEWQPPVFPVLLCLWRNIDGSIFFARLFSVTCIVLSTCGVWRLSRQVMPQIHPGWLTASFALHPFAIFASLEIRLYALSILLSVVMLNLFYDGYVLRQSRRSRIGFVVAVITGLHTNFLLAVLVPGLAIVLVSMKQWRSLARYISGMAAVAILFLPTLYVFLPFLQTRLDAYDAHVSVTQACTFVSSSVPYFMLPLPREPTFYSRTVRVGVALLLIVCLMSVIFADRHAITKFFAAQWFALAGTAAFLGAFFYFTKTEPRTPYAYPLFVLTLLAGWSSLALRGDQWSARSVNAAAVMGCFFIVSLGISYGHMAKDGDWKNVAMALRQNERPGQPILTFIPEASLLLGHYYDGPNPMCAIPAELGFDHFDPQKFALTDETILDEVVAKSVANCDTFWLVTYDAIRPEYCEGVDRYNCELLESYVDQHFEVVSLHCFYKTRLRKLTQRSTTKLTQ